MRKYLIAFSLFILACSTTMQSIQREYRDAAFSPQFDRTKTYRLAILPINNQEITIDETAINSLYDFTALELLKTSHFVLVERKAIEALLKEQEFSVTGIVDASTAAKLGKILGADAVMLTEISELKRDEFFQDENAYDAKVFIRIIDVSTAEILFYGKGRGESMQGKINALEMATHNAIKALQGGMK